MGALMASYDWSRTPLGPSQNWPQSLKTAIGIMLTSRFAMWMAWGDGLTFFCNDAYRPTLGVKADWALGSRSDQVWAEIWSEIGPRIETVLRSGSATWDESLQLFLERSGYAEETYHTFSYSPLRDDSSTIAGMLCVVTEETERVIGERRLGTLRHLAAELSTAKTELDVGAAVERSIGANGRDLPFALIYLFQPDDSSAKLIGTTGIPAGHPAAPPTIDLMDPNAPWPAGQFKQTGGLLVVDDLAGLGQLPAGAWQEPPRQALLCPIEQPGQDAVAGFLVTGLNPFRPFDAAYSGFIELVAGQIAASLANAHAYDEERRRADALAELDRAKTAFFSNVSHEFRTPLTLMLGPLEDLLGRPTADLAATDLALVETAHRNGLRLLKLVNMLLDFARIEAGRMLASYRPVDLAALTTDIASSFRSAMERAGLDYRVVALPLPQPVHVDRDMWEKVVLNLLSNAFKFTFEGAVALTLAPSADGRAAVLSVRDTGTGIPAAELPRLFERFHRVEGARGRSFEGSGIGLALVQELVKLHGGTSGVESDEGRGSVFTVTIPFGTRHLPADRIDAEPADGSGASRAQAYVEEALRWLPGGAADLGEVVLHDDIGGSPLPPTGSGRILLADDNADMREYVRRLLVARGYEVEAVDDGDAALAAARRRAPDLVLSDVMMPGLDGFGLLQALRADPQLRDLPVVLLSARAGEEARVEGIDAGADDYLTKPFSARELLARVGANLAMARIRRESLLALQELNETLEARVAERTQERDRIWRLSRELMLVAQADSTALAVNPAWTATLGWAEGEVVGRKVIDLVHPEDWAATSTELRSVAHGTATLNFDLRLRHRDGTYRWIVWTAVPHEGADLRRGARCHRDPSHRGAAAAGAEDGDDRPAHWRRRARLQQSADRRRRQSGNGPAACGTARRRRAGPAHPPCRGPGHARRPACRGLDPAAARLLAPPAARAQAGQRQPPRRRHVRSVDAHAGRADRDRDGPGRRPVADPGRSQPARERRAEPRGQRARRHAGWRPADDRDRQRASRRDLYRRAPTGFGSASTCWWPSATPAPACRAPCRRRRSSPSSPPRMPVTAPGSACRRSTASSSSRTAT